MPYAMTDPQLTASSIAFSIKAPFFKFALPTTKNKAQQPHAPLVVNSHGVGKANFLDTLDFRVPEFLPRCGMVTDPLERYEREMERIETCKRLEAEDVRALIIQERDKRERREASKLLKRQKKQGRQGHRPVKKFIHRRTDSGVAFTEEEVGAFRGEESAQAEKLGGGPRMLKERVFSYFGFA